MQDTVAIRCFPLDPSRKQARAMGPGLLLAVHDVDLTGHIGSPRACSARTKHGRRGVEQVANARPDPIVSRLQPARGMIPGRGKRPFELPIRDNTDGLLMSFVTWR